MLVPRRVDPMGRDLTRELQAKISCARSAPDLLAYFVKVEPTNNGSERLLRPAVVQRRVTDGYRAVWVAEGETAIRTVVDAARLTGAKRFATTLKTVSVEKPP